MGWVSLTCPSQSSVSQIGKHIVFIINTHFNLFTVEWHCVCVSQFPQSQICKISFYRREQRALLRHFVNTEQRQKEEPGVAVLLLCMQTCGVAPKPLSARCVWLYQAPLRKRLFTFIIPYWETQTCELTYYKHLHTHSSTAFSNHIRQMEQGWNKQGAGEKATPRKMDSNPDRDKTSGEHGMLSTAHCKIMFYCLDVGTFRFLCVNTANPRGNEKRQGNKQRLACLSVVQRKTAVWKCSTDVLTTVLQMCKLPSKTQVAHGREGGCFVSVLVWFFLDFMWKTHFSSLTKCKDLFFFAITCSISIRNVITFEFTLKGLAWVHLPSIVKVLSLP